MTISLDKLRAVQTLVTHDSCGDGTGSALLIKDALPEAEVVFVQHGTDAFKTLQAKPGMLFCDIIPPADRADEFIAAGALVLDHHRTARSVVERFGENGIFADENQEPGVSGTMLAYQHVWKPLCEAEATPWLRGWVEQFATLVGIRDTWQNRDPRWEAACEQNHLLFFMPNTEWLKMGLRHVATEYEHFEWVGEVLARKQAKAVQKSINGGVRLTSRKGSKILVFNSKSNTSDAAEKLGREVDAIIGFGYEADNGVPHLILSCRSHADFDCSAFSRRLGGGGHTKAAGASLPLPENENPYQTILRLVDAYEDA